MNTRRDFRYDREEGEFLGRCPRCASSGQTKCWWPLTTEFWDPRSGLQVCRACHNLAKRLSRRQTAEERRAKQRAYYRDNRAHRLAWRHAYHAAHKEEINRRRRERYAASRAQKSAPQQMTLWND